MDTSNPGAAGGVEIAGVPLEFVLFALTLAGVALLHRHSLQVALVGLASVVIYKLLATGFDGIAGFAGFAHHLRLEWVVLLNLFGLLMGFALLSRHFEESGVPTRLPDFLPDDWRGCFVLLVMVFVSVEFPRQHRRGADRRRRSHAPYSGVGCTSVTSRPWSPLRTQADPAA